MGLYPVLRRIWPRAAFLPVFVGKKRKPLEPYLFRGRSARGNDQEVETLPPVEDRLAGFS